MLFSVRNYCQPYSRPTCPVLLFEPLQYNDEIASVII